MEKILILASYVANFILSPSFQDRQDWVKWLIKKLSIVRPNYWTASRFVGGVLTIVISIYLWQLSIIVFLFFTFTDFLDGKIARYLGIANGDTGAILDGLADKAFVIPVIWYWGRAFSSFFLLAFMTIVEIFGNLLILILQRLFKKEKRGIYEHLNVGKHKFALQVALACLLWLAHFSPNWILWPAIVNIILFMITIFAILSVWLKIKRYFSLGLLTQH